jgi:hypothetical protein
VLAQQYSIDWFTIAGGGGTSAGGSYSLSGTVGQTEAGPVMTSSEYRLYGGFWSPFARSAAPPPVLPVQQNRVIDVLAILLVTNTATSLRIGVDALSYQLLNSPANAVIDANGIITWTPSRGQGGTTNQIVSTVTDNGSPALRATNSFAVVVRGWFSGMNLDDPGVATATPSGDGFSNLMKYALGIDPAHPADDPNALVVTMSAAAGPEYVTMTFRRRTNTPWLAYIPEVSGDTQVWFSDADYIQQTQAVPMDDQFDLVTVQDLIPTTPASPRFIRLRVVSN